MVITIILMMMMLKKRSCLKVVALTDTHQYNRLLLTPLYRD